MIPGMEHTGTEPHVIQLQAEGLSPQAMAPYGWVLDTTQAFAAQAGRVINAGTSRRADIPGELSLTAGGGRPLACVFRASAQRVTGPWRMLERHRWGTQTFVPLGGAAPGDQGDTVCVLLVALGDTRPDLNTLRAFRVGVQQAFTLKPGVWHHPLIATHDRDFLVIERQAQAVDCEVMALQRPVRLLGLR